MARALESEVIDRDIADRFPAFAAPIQAAWRTICCWSMPRAGAARLQQRVQALDQRRHQVGGARSAGGHADTDSAGAAGVALGREAASLFVTRQNRSQPLGIADQRLVQRHAGTSGIGEDAVDALVNQRLDQDVRSADPHGVPRGRLTRLGGRHVRDLAERLNRDNRFRLSGCGEPACQSAIPFARITQTCASKLNLV